MKKSVDKPGRLCYNTIRKKKKGTKKMKTKKHDKTRGWYTYEDGFEHWVFGMSAAEKRNEIRKHGKIVRFVNTD